MRRFWKRAECSSDEEKKVARLVEAEKSLGELQQRAHVAITYLDGRHRRNHWRESVQEMIEGGQRRERY